MNIKNKKRFCIMIFIIMAVIILMALIINGIFGNIDGDAGLVKDGVVTYAEKIVNTTYNKEIYNIRKAIELKYVDEDTKYVEFFAKITGFKNSKSLIKFCENTFNLMEIENKN